MTQQKHEQLHAEKTENVQPQGLVPSRDALRAMDIDVAMKVMGWRAGTFSFGHAWYDEAGAKRAGINWSPTADIAAAWLVMQKMDAAHLHVEVGSMVNGWRARVGACTATAPTPTFAICRAALAAVGAA